MDVNLIELSTTERPKRDAYRVSGNDWVKLGQDNDYFEQLADLYGNANLHRSIIGSIADRVSGEGFETRNQLAFASQWSKFNSLINFETLKKVALESTIFGTFALKIITNQAGTEIAKVESVSMVNLRPNEMNEDGEISGWWFCRNWKDWRKKDFEPEFIESFDFEATRQKGEFIYVSRPYEPGMEYVPQPSYSGAIDWIQADIEIGKYHLSNIQNGFSGVTAVLFKNGEPDPEVKRKIEMKFKQKFTGSQGDKIAFIYSNPGEETVEFETINLDNADKQYEVLSKEIDQRIIYGHKITSPILIGLKQDTGLGNNAEEMKNANDYFEKLVIRPKQRFILEAIKKITTYNGLTLKISIEPLQLFDLPDPEPEEQTQLSEEKKILTGEDQKYLIDYLSDKGEDESELLKQGYKVISEDDEEPDTQLKIKGTQLMQLADYGIRPDKLSKYDVKAPDGSGTWLVRYQYALSQVAQPPEIIPTSRQFCRHMIDLKNSSSRVYRREVLENLNNPEFGSYNIFWYKGSYNCRHVWRRKLYFKPADGTTVNPVGAVPYVAQRTNDKRATSPNKPAN